MNNWKNTVVQHYSRLIIRSVLSINLFILGIMLTACGGGSDDSGNNGTTTVTTTSFTVPLSSLEVVPLVNSNASANAQLSYDSATGIITGQVIISGTQSNIENVHLHDGAAGIAGGIIVTLKADATNTNQYNIPDNQSLLETQANKLLSGATYLQVHTVNVGSGELRGQVLLSNSNVSRIKIPMSGLEIINRDSATSINTPVNSTGSGDALLLVNKISGAIYGGFKASNLLGKADKAHIHDGAAGTAGGLIITLAQDSVDSNLFSIPASSVLTAANLAKLLSNNTYAQIHSVAKPAGELRGQILTQESNMSRYTIAMDGLQVVPPVTTNATGQAVLLVNNNTGAVFGGMSANNLQGTADKGHVHEGAAGQAGGVLITFDQNVADLNLYSIPVATILSPANLTKLKTDISYVQIHSATNPGGELRGQIINP